MVEIRRMGPQIGVEVTGVDVKTLDDAGFAPIYQAWLDHNVMVVRDQELTIEEFLHYSRRFGLVVPHPSKSTRHPEVPEITLLGVNKFDADGKLNEAIYRRGAEGWHTDGAYDADPFKATQLYALAIPSTGGDTLFANGYAAYAALPERLKQRLEGTGRRVHLWRTEEEARTPERRGSRLEAGAPSHRPHPSRDGTEVAVFRSRQDRVNRGRLVAGKR